MQIKVSIVVPAFNEEKLLPDTLRAIQQARAAFDRRQWASELIVCDNNSTDRTRELAEAGGARVVFEPINQIGRARNAGAAAALGQWLLFIDADSRPSVDLFDDVARAIESGRVLAGGSTLKVEAGSWFIGCLTQAWIFWSRLARHMAGSFIFCQADVFRELGGFSSQLYAGEEIELSRRFKARARQLRQKVVILSRFPLITSGRKAKLYSGRELLGFMWRAAFRPRRVLTDRNACAIWYDGRR